MNCGFRRSVVHFVLALLVLACSALSGFSQQTLGSLNGTVLDASGAAVPDASVTAVSAQTGLTRTTKSISSGYWQILDLPLGNYRVTVTQTNFETETIPGLLVQEGRATTVNASLKPGGGSESVTVNANPMLNATDTTNGYTLDKAQIAATPLATGSFTQLAILAPGVSSQFIAGVGTNQGLGNQNIWANGQRATSNTMTLNGIDITNLFNGNTASEQTSQRYQFNIGEGNSTGGQTQDNIAVYGSNGNGLASPPPEFLQEISILTSMYDAQSGETSGAHIGMITSSGTNDIHGQIYGQRGTNWINADPFFYKQDVLLGTIQPQFVSPELHKWVAGGTVGGPIFKNKLFFFLGYNHLYTSDQYGALSQFQVPAGLSSDRSLAGISAACTSYVTATIAGGGSKKTSCPAQTAWNSAAIGILQAQLPNGQFLIPSADAGAVGQLADEEPDAALVGSSIFKGDQATASLDYNLSGTDRLSAKYFYQHLPTVSPYADSNYTGFPEFEDNGAQVVSLSNAITLGPHVNWTQLIGVARQKVYSSFTEELDASDVGITMPAQNFFPGIELVDFAQDNSESTTSRMGPYSTGAFVDTGYFETRISPSSDLIWSHGKHTVTVGGSFSYDQLNIRNLDENHATLEEKTFTNFLEGKLTSGTILEGNSNRYYRSHDIGGYGMDKWQILPNVSITVGVRYDFDGPLSEKYGNLFNFEPKLYASTASEITNSGFVVAGNNKQFGTPGVSDSTLTGRQWGIGPRLGVAWAPKWNNGKVVWRAGAGIYYDRGQYFQYLSPPAGAGISGPFGVTEEAPFAAYTGFNGSLAEPFTSIVAPTTPSNIASLMPTIDSMESTCTAYNIYNSIDLNKFNCNDGEPDGPLVIGNYNTANKLPYTEDWTLDFQWQPTHDMSVDIGYVGNRGKHQVIPLPFNESVLCTPGNYQTIAACNGQQYSYSVQVLSNLDNPTPGGTDTTPYAMANEPYDTFSGGNVDMRVPFPGFDPNSASFTAAGISAFDALEAHLEKQMSHNIQAGVSYTWSHTLDEQSDVGLFFTGDNPNDLRSSYADADFDETHNLTFNFIAKVPNAIKNSGNPLKFLVNNWSFLGIVVLESGEPYSIYDYSGTAGGQYFGTNAEIINPILPLQPGISRSSVRTGKTGAFTSATKVYPSCSGGTSVYSPALDACDFEVPLVAPGVNGVPPCDTTTAGGNAGPGGGPLCDVYETNFVPGQRNIFRQWPQRRADITIQKGVPLRDRYDVNYQFEVFNVTNTPSFDIPQNDITLNPNFSELNGNGNGTQVQPAASTTVTTPSGAGNCSGSATACAYELYTVPGQSSNKLGVVTDTIGSGRIVEMALHFTF
jgi:hypothetical protein